MCKAFEEVWEEGYQEGYREGLKEYQREVAFQLFDAGKSSFAEIAFYTKLSLDEVKALYTDWFTHGVLYAQMKEAIAAR